MRGYELIYPSQEKETMAKYESYLEKSSELWDEFYMGKKFARSKLNDALSKKVTKMFNTLQQPGVLNKPGSTNQQSRVEAKQ
jgi:hypothetical protein